MMPFSPLLQFTIMTLGPATSQDFEVNNVLTWSFKILFIVLSILFVIFSFVVIRQVKVMNDTVTTVLGPVLQVVSIAVFILSIILMIAAFTRL